MTDSTKPTTKTTTIRLPIEDIEHLREMAAREDRSVSSIVRLALRQYMRFKEEG